MKWYSIADPGPHFPPSIVRVPSSLPVYGAAHPRWTPSLAFIAASKRYRIPSFEAAVEDTRRQSRYRWRSRTRSSTTTVRHDRVDVLLPGGRMVLAKHQGALTIRDADGRAARRTDDGPRVRARGLWGACPSHAYAVFSPVRGLLTRSRSVRQAGPALVSTSLGGDCQPFLAPVVQMSPG